MLNTVPVQMSPSDFKWLYLNDNGMDLRLLTRQDVYEAREWIPAWKTGWSAPGVCIFSRQSLHSHTLVSLAACWWSPIFALASILDQSKSSSRLRAHSKSYKHFLCYHIPVNQMCHSPLNLQSTSTLTRARTPSPLVRGPGSPHETRLVRQQVHFTQPSCRRESPATTLNLVTAHNLWRIPKKVKGRHLSVWTEWAKEWVSWRTGLTTELKTNTVQKKKKKKVEDEESKVPLFGLVYHNISPWI